MELYGINYQSHYKKYTFEIHFLEQIFPVYFCLNRYIKQHDQSRLDQEPNSHDIGHPVNAYHLIKHVALGWRAIEKDILNNDTYLTQNLGTMIWNDVLDDI